MTDYFQRCKRPALQLTGYFEHFESRIQMIGNVEYTFIQQMK